MDKFTKVCTCMYMYGVNDTCGVKLVSILHSIGTWQGTTPVAMKKLKNKYLADEFLSEARMLQQFDFPTVVRYVLIFVVDVLIRIIIIIPHIDFLASILTLKVSSIW